MRRLAVLMLMLGTAGGAVAGPPSSPGPAAPPVRMLQLQAAPGPQKTPPPGGSGAPTRPIPTDPVTARYSPGYEACMRRATSTLDIVDCAGRETERWDARLNRAYQARIAALNDRQRAALKRAEKTWLAFRDADCAAYEDEDWGSISRIDASQCRLRRTAERALELEAFPADRGPG